MVPPSPMPTLGLANGNHNPTEVRGLLFMSYLSAAATSL